MKRQSYLSVRISMTILFDILIKGRIEYAGIF